MKEISVRIKVEGFKVPNFLVTKSKDKTTGVVTDRCYHLSEISTEDLKDMCDTFVKDVFTRANKEKEYRELYCKNV